MNVFLTLVKNDLNIARNSRKFNIFWKRVYIFLALLSGSVFYTVLLIYGKVTPYFISLIPVFLIFSSFPISLRLIKREWRNSTIGWWLQLPYSRKILLGAKFTAGFIRFLRIALIVLVVSIILWFEGGLLRPDIWNQYNLYEVFIQLSKIYLQILVFSPLFIVYGILTVIFQKTRFSHLVLILWIVFGEMMSLIGTTFFKIDFNMESGFTWVYSISGLSAGVAYLLGVLVILIATILIFLLSTVLMERFVEV